MGGGGTRTDGGTCAAGAVSGEAARHGQRCHGGRVRRGVTVAFGGSEGCGAIADGDVQCVVKGCQPRRS